MESCPEARAEVKFHHLDYFTTVLDFNKPAPIKYHVNLRVDIICLPTSNRRPSFPTSFNMHCGNCSGLPPPRHQFGSQFCRESCPRFKRKSYCPTDNLAIECDDWFAWYYPEDGLDPDNMDSMEILFKHNVKELLLVIGYLPLKPGSNFVEPTISPYSYAKTAGNFVARKEDESWEKLAQRMRKTMKEYKDKLLSDERSMVKRVMHLEPGSGLDRLDPDTLGFGPGEIFEYYDFIADDEAPVDFDSEESRRKYKDEDNIATYQICGSEGMVDKWTI